MIGKDYTQTKASQKLRYQTNNMEVFSPSWQSIFQQNPENYKLFGCLNTFDPQQCHEMGLRVDLMALLRSVDFVG